MVSPETPVKVVLLTELPQLCARRREGCRFLFQAGRATCCTVMQPFVHKVQSTYAYRSYTDGDHGEECAQVNDVTNDVREEDD